MKKLRKYLLYFLMLVLGILLLVFLVLNLPFTQRYATRQVNQILTGAELPIHLDAIRKILPGSVRIQGIVISGQEGDTLIYAGELQADIRLMALIRKRLVLPEVNLDGAVVTLERDSNAKKLNIAEAFQRGNRKDLPPGEKPPAKWLISIKEGALTNIDFRMNDTLDGIHISQAAAGIELENFRVSLPDREISCRSLFLGDANGRVDLSPRLIPPKLKRSPWNLGFRSLALEEVDFGFSKAADSLELETSVGKGSIKANEFDLISRRADIKLISFKESSFAIQTGSASKRTEDPPDAKDGSTPWEIAAETIEIKNSLAVVSPEPGGTFKDMDLQLEDLRLDNKQAGIELKNLAFEMDNGFTLKKMHGELDSKQDLTQLEMEIRTGNSRMDLKSSARAGYAEILGGCGEIKGAELELEQSRISLLDLACFWNDFEELPVYIPLTASHLDIRGTLDLAGPLLSVSECEVSQKKNFNITLEGGITNPFHLSDATGDLDLEIAGLDQEWLESLAAELGFSKTLPVLSDLQIHGSVTDSLKSPDIHMEIVSQWGDADMSGSLDFRKELFLLAYSLQRVALGDLLFVPDLGSFTGKGEIKGRGFSGESLNASYYLQLDTLGFREYNYGHTQLTGTLGPGACELQMVANDPSLKTDMNVALSLADSTFEVRASGILQAQMNQLHLYKDTLSIETNIDALLSSRGEVLESDLSARKMTFIAPGDTAVIRELNANFNTDGAESFIHTDADFFLADLYLMKPLNELDSLGKGYQHYFASFRNASHITASNRVSVLPEIHGTGHISYHELLDIFLGDSSLRFTNLDATITRQADQNSLHTTLTGDDLSYKMLGAGSFNAVVKDSAGLLDIELVADSTTIFAGPEHRLELHGDFSSGTTMTTVSVDDYQDQNMYQIEVAGRVDSMQIVLDIPSLELTLNGEQWQLEGPELLSIDLANNTVLPAVKMNRDSSFLHISSRSQDQFINYTLDMNQVELTSLIGNDLFQGEPDGTFTGGIYYRTDRDIRRRITSDLQISDLRYSGQAFNDVLLDGVLTLGPLGAYSIDLLARMDSLDVRLEGGKNEDGERDLEGRFNHFPLILIEPFTREQLSELDGSISGDFILSERKGAEQFEGKLNFHDAFLKVNILNSAFRIPDQRIEVSDQRVLFNEFTVMDTLDKPLKLDGYIDFRKPAPVMTDLNISSSELQVMRRDKNSRAPFTGNIFIDSRISIKGPLTRPDIGGTLHLSEGTEIFYHHMEDLRMTESEKIVNFVDYTADNREITPPALSGHGRLGGSSIETLIEIDPSTMINFTLAKRMFDIFLEVKGGGNIQYNMENEMMAVSGMYEVGEGSVLLKLVGWPNKSFSLKEDGYIRWDGRVENPELRIEAENKVSTSYLNPIDGKNRDIDFFVILSLSEYLTDLNVVFTISTPDQYVMSIINTLSPEEQMQQALSVLLFEVIDLPGISSSTDYMTQQVNQILSSQMNQLTKSTIKGVDISFGLDTYDQTSQEGGDASKTSLSYEVRKSLLNNRAQIEVSGRLNDSNEEPGSTDHSLNNVSFEYRLDSAATKYLKVYNEHTYDDVFEGEVVKTGIGFSYRKRYKTFKDIWRRKK